MKISLLLAMAENRVIGLGGNPPFDLPWHLPADLKHFKRLTVGHVIIMGRKTWESIGRPLPRRRSVVITRNSEYRVDHSRVTVVGCLDDALAAVAGEDEVFVVGGAEIFALALPRADRLYLTRVHADIKGDVLMPAAALPESSRDVWELLEAERHEADERHAHAFTFELWERRLEPAQPPD